MAEQQGLVKIKGRIGDISYYKTADGYLVKDKGGVSDHKRMNADSMTKTRKAMAEFGNAGRTTKLIYQSLRSIIKNVADSRMYGRLQARMLQITKTDPVNQFGERRPEFGSFHKLIHFQLNVQNSLKAKFLGEEKVVIDRTAGTAKFTIDAFIPSANLAPPKGATHYQFIMAASELKLEDEDSVMDSFETGYLPIDSNVTAVINQTLNYTPATTEPVIAVLGIKFWQDINGFKEPFHGTGDNSMDIIGVDF
jgi:hypothetical protein